MENWVNKHGGCVNLLIAICDDEESFREDVKKAVYSYSDLHRLEVVIEEYECGEDLLKSSNDYEVIFLDYKMEGINGLETALRLREKNVDSIIIFLTSFPKFVFSAFEVDTFRFFRKPLDTEKLNKALDDYFTTRRKNYPILIKSGHETICIHTNEIMYLKADDKKCYIKMVDNRLHLPRLMKSIESLLPKNDFSKVHKTFIVNLSQIHTYDNENVFFRDGTCVPISRHYMSSFKNAYRIYVKNRSI
ncbi:MAG: LytTR family DNA-binding domain-containing protein [Oscillospiraceae bacterium]|jgi:DNA-binding LytR/AlgR family response regulator|nr:LytTR family DNA-binding domain-containing protein [Oscillospiraceae bacterium]